MALKLMSGRSRSFQQAHSMRAAFRRPRGAEVFFSTDETARTARVARSLARLARGGKHSAPSTRRCCVGISRRKRPATTTSTRTTTTPPTVSTLRWRRGTTPTCPTPRLAAIVARASGLEEVLRDADASPSPGSKGGGGAEPTPDALPPPREARCQHVQLALSSLHLRGGADHAQAALHPPRLHAAMGVAPDVVARCVVADACARAGDAEAAAVLADARDAAGAGKRSKSKKKKKKKTKRKATAGPVEALGVLWEDDGPRAAQTRGLAHPRHRRQTLRRADPRRRPPRSIRRRGAQLDQSEWSGMFIGWTDPPRG